MSLTKAKKRNRPARVLSLANTEKRDARRPTLRSGDLCDPIAFLKRSYAPTSDGRVIAKVAAAKDPDQVRAILDAALRAALDEWERALREPD